MTDKTTIRRRPKAQARRKVTPKPSRKPGWLASLPFEGETVEHWVSRGLFATVGVALLGIGWMAGVPGYVGTEAAQVAGRMGFQVKRVEVTGVDRMDRLTVYGVALDQHSMAMPLVDLDKVRWRLKQHAWIEDARVSRRLPDTLVVDIVERKPAAVWQNQMKLSLIDKSGHVLERVDPNAMPDLPVLLGYNARSSVEEFARVMDRAPSLARRVAGATRVGDRRWDVRFNTGETLALPEGELAAGNAFLRFARIDGVERLLGRNFARFDMRNPEKMVIRKPASAPTAAPKSDDEKPAEPSASASSEKGDV